MPHFFGVVGILYSSTPLVSCRELLMYLGTRYSTVLSFERISERQRQMRIARFLALASVARAFTTPSLRTKNDANAVMMRSTRDEETSRRRFLGSAASIVALFPQVTRAAPNRRVGGLANKIRNVGYVLVRPSVQESVRHARSSYPILTSTLG